jgi:peptide/nickel transport system ATP-binding protein
MASLLSIANLSVSFKTETENVQAVKSISFSVDAGETLAIVGESGSGKSVSAYSILGLLPKSANIEGDIIFNGDAEQSINLNKQNQKELQTIRGNKIAMIFQEPMTSLNPVFTCGQQVMEALLVHKKISKAEAKQQTISWFEKVKLPNPAVIFNKYPHQLSGGQKQRVMIAMAMCCEPSLLICDEPTTALDVTVQKTILELIKDLQKQTGMAVLFITHDLGLVGEIANRVLVMYKGEMVELDKTEQVFKSPKHPYTKALLACRPSNHKKGERLPVVSDFLNNVDWKKEFDTKLTASASPNEKNSNSINRESIIQVENLEIKFPIKRNLFGRPTEYTNAINDLSFEIFKGETLGLVGESGCGKTTLGRALIKLISPTSGRILINGTDLNSIDKKELTQRRKDIQLIFQDPYSSLNPRISIGEAISEPLKVHGILDSTSKRKEKVIELLEKVNLKSEHYNRYPHEFSGGQRQRIVIARALSLAPNFLVCDESVSALDVSVQAQVLNLLNDLKREMGFTMVFISHDLSVVKYISDRILVMNKGKIEELGDAEQVYTKPKSAYTRQLLEAIPGKALSTLA